MVVVFISYLFPNNAKFKYNFEKGQTWRYEDLVAPFNFAILKPAEEVYAEIEQLRNDVSPYYEMDMEVARSVKQAFRTDFNAQLKMPDSEAIYRDVFRNTDSYLNYG